MIENNDRHDDGKSILIVKGGLGQSMSEKNFPNWMLVAVVCGFGELTYWLNGRWGFALTTKISLGATVLVGFVALIVYVNRVMKRISKRQSRVKREL
jgi:hypothetical protein